MESKRPFPEVPAEPTITVAPERPAAGDAVDRVSSLGSLRPSTDPSFTPPPMAKPPSPRRRARVGLAGAAALAVVAVLVVHPWKSAPRHITMHISGTPAPRTTPSGAREHWPVGSTVTVTLDPSLSTANPGATEAVVNAFATWNKAATGAPTLAPVIATSPGVAAEDGVNRVVYAPITIPGMETAVAVTVSYADEDGVVIEADTILNNAYAFTVMAEPAPATAPSAACGGSYDVQNVATHEAGHLLGMGEDMTDEANTMFIKAEPCQTHKRDLTHEDIESMTALYAGAASANAGGCGH